MNKDNIKVYFVGAGPGDPELMTIKGRKCIERADLLLFAGSLVPKEVVNKYAKPGARVVDSASMTLDETHAMIIETIKNNGLVARVHTGDPSLYGAIREQMVLLEREAVPYEVVPGVTAAFAAAAATGISFTLPERCQSLIITRMEGRTKVPEQEKLEDLARHNTSMAIYLSAGNSLALQDKLIDGGLAEETPVIVAYRVGWPDQIILSTRLSNLSASVNEAGITRQAVFLVLPGQDAQAVPSKLYNAAFAHGFRK
jgi:precorrin-4/cobalt-precorrin-4 C11-methyltransferase